MSPVEELQQSPPPLSPAAPPNPLRRIRLSERAGDRIFRWTMLAFGAMVMILAAGICWELMRNSKLAWDAFGFKFLITSVWDPVMEVYGALPFIYGTIVSSIIALMIAVPLGVGSAIFLAELAPKKVSNILTFFIELLAAIPSVILGLMGIFVLVPAVKSAQPFLTKTLGFLPFFQGHAYGIGLLTAGIILAIMILPYITSISRDVILSVPQVLKEASLGLGATHWEMVRMVVLPYARSGILGSIFLALGRALGETMAVTMVIGNTPKISLSLFDPAYSMAAVIANEFSEATSDLYVHSLIAIALTLFAITIIVNGLARLMIYKTTLSKGRRS
ncbi:MAG: Phosphate transport system permease protein PstC [Elusimicrobia bacterium]|nr:Phosphate transport system permease protein PstC [Elusimicrobiota bacterium]